MVSRAFSISIRSLISSNRQFISCMCVPEFVWQRRSSCVSDASIFLTSVDSNIDNANILFRFARVAFDSMIFD